jgi:transcriptional regulator with XRE-family HTH domain
VLNFSNIGEALRRLRQERDLKQAQVAEGAGITSPMLSAYETGKQKPSFATIDKILTAMDLDPIDLVSALKELQQNADSEEGRQTSARIHRLHQSRIQNSELASDEERVVLHLLPALVWAMRYLKG